MVLSKLGYPLTAVVLNHSDKMVNDFFTRQRQKGSVRPIEIGISIRGCFNVLKSNGLLAMLGDRDFLKGGLPMKFFNRSVILPKGPAVFSQKMGSAIVPSFMIRNDDDTFKLIFEKPIFPGAQGRKEEQAIENLIYKYLPILESYIRKYPTQWYVFRNIWSENGKRDLRPDTIV